MNEISLKGIIQNIRYSHISNNVEYNRADLIVPRKNGKEDIIDLRFKKYSNKYLNGQFIEIVGNLRSYSTQKNGVNKVNLYCFTYFDIPKEDYPDNNVIYLDGRICKLNEQQIMQKDNKKYTQFILANNIIKNNHKINNYINCIAFDNMSDYISTLNVSDKLTFKGELHSRTYKKQINDNDYEIKIAHEVIVKELITGDDNGN